MRRPGTECRRCTVGDMTLLGSSHYSGERGRSMCSMRSLQILHGRRSSLRVLPSERCDGDGRAHAGRDKADLKRYTSLITAYGNQRGAVQYMHSIFVGHPPKFEDTHTLLSSILELWCR